LTARLRSVIRIAQIARRVAMLKRIRNTLLDDELEWQMTWLPDGWFGLYEGDKITISPTCFLPTIIHECLHHLDEKLSEKQVERLSYEIYNSLSQRQKKNLLTIFFWRTHGQKKTKRIKTVPRPELSPSKTKKPGRA
jgi:hypothetical protein